MVGKRCMFTYDMGQKENWNEWKFTVVLIKRSFTGIMIPPDSWFGHCDKRGLILKKINSSLCAEKSQWAEWTLSILFEWLCISFPFEKAMAPHSRTLAWKIPWTEEPGRLQSMGSRRVVHDCTTSLPLFTFMHWRRKWQPTPVFLPGESRGQGSLVGCRLWGRTELDTTGAT